MCRNFRTTSYTELLQAAREIAADLHAHVDVRGSAEMMAEPKSNQMGMQLSLGLEDVSGLEGISGQATQIASPSIGGNSSNQSRQIGNQPITEKDTSAKNMIPGRTMPAICVDYGSVLAAQEHSQKDIPTQRGEFDAQEEFDTQDYFPLTLKISPLIWGYEADWSSHLLFNTRVETAAGPKENMWSDSYRCRHCVLPATRFDERNTEKLTIDGYVPSRCSFTQKGNAPFFLAGIWRENRFSLLTCAPNSVVSPVHNRMPIVMGIPEAVQWLNPYKKPHFRNDAIDLICTPEFRYKHV